MKPKKKPKKAHAPTEQDVINEAKRLRELVIFTALTFVSLLVLVLLFWLFA